MREYVTELIGTSGRQDFGPYWLAQAAGALVTAGLATFEVNPAPLPALYLSGQAIGGRAGFAGGAAAALAFPLPEPR
jgi:hypothetical protein